MMQTQIDHTLSSRVAINEEAQAFLKRHGLKMEILRRDAGWSARLYRVDTGATVARPPSDERVR